MCTRKAIGDKGFSLVELSVVIAIIGLLATVAIPSLSRWVLRSKQTEAKTMLTSLHTAMQTFHQHYQDYTSLFSCIGFEPRGRLRYLTGFFGMNVPRMVVSPELSACNTTWDSTTVAYCNNVPGHDCSNLPETNITMFLDLSLFQNSFVAQSISDLKLNGTVDLWTMNHRKILTHDTDGTQ